MNEMLLIQTRYRLNLRTRILLRLVSAFSSGVKPLKINIVWALRENEHIDVMCLSQTRQMLQTDGVLRDVPKE